MRNRLLGYLKVLAVGCALAALAAPTFAQRRGPYRRPVYATSAYTKVDVDRVIRRVEERSDAFVGIFDKALDRSALDGSNREDRLNERAKDLEKELDKVRKEFDRAEGYMDIRENVVKALNVSEGINAVFRNRRMGPSVERQWVLLRSELNKLAKVYNIRPLKG